MKVLMFSDKYGTVTTTFIRNEVNYFAWKHEFVYVAGNIVNPDPGVRTISLPFNRSLISRKLHWYLWKADRLCSFKDSSYSKKLNELIRKEKPDVIHCHFAYEAMKLLQNMDGGMKVPVFVHFHGYDASEMLRKKSYVNTLKDLLKSPMIFPIVVSSVMKEKLKEQGIPTGKAEVLRCGIDLELFKPSITQRSGEQKTFVQISSLSEKKGHDLTLRAFALFLERAPQFRDKIRLVFAGEGDRMIYLKKLASELGLDKIVSFVGVINSAGAVKLLDKADVFVHHSITPDNGDEEGIPTSIMEAMAMKLPVLSTNHAGIPELVKHGVNGLLCNERDVEIYAKQIGEIIKWEKLDVNRSVVEADYNMLKHNHQLEQMYIKAAASFL